jgi:energy-coupling factor transport system ATP-binding protein
MGLAREEIRLRAEKCLSRVGMEDLKDRHPQQLSGGQSQRLALASILAVQPEIFILDEPTSQLDPLGVEEVFDVITDMHHGGNTLIVVSQDLDHLAIRADRLMVIDKGEIKWDGEPRKVLLEAAETRYPILIPDVLEISRKLRATGRIPSTSPVPLTVEQAAKELSSIDTPGSAAQTIAASRTSRNSKVESSEALVFEDVHFDYPTGVSAIRGISLSLDEGCVCIVGQNGAGKTTFAKHLNGLLRPTRGRVLVRGKDTREYRVAELAREVGLAFQNPDDQLFRSTVEEEVRFGADYVGASPDEAEEGCCWTMTRGRSSVEKRLWPVPTWNHQRSPSSGSYLVWTRPCSRPRSFWPSSSRNRGSRAEPTHRGLVSATRRPEPSRLPADAQGGITHLRVRPQLHLYARDRGRNGHRLPPR